MDNNDHITDPNATDELPVTVAEVETPASTFTTDWDISTRLFIQIVINPELNLPGDVMALVLEARDRLRDTERALAHARIYSATDQAYQIDVLRTQLVTVTAERDALANTATSVQTEVQL